jgi:hypothetical protein
MPLNINTSDSVVSERYFDVKTIHLNVLATVYVMPRFCNNHLFSILELEKKCPNREINPRASKHLENKEMQQREQRLLLLSEELPIKKLEWQILKPVKWRHKIKQKN